MCIDIRYYNTKGEGIGEMPGCCCHLTEREVLQKIVEDILVLKPDGLNQDESVVITKTVFGWEITIPRE